MLAVLFRHSTGPAPAFRSTHQLLGSLPLSAKPIALGAHQGGPVRRAHPLRMECRKKLLSLRSGENCTVFTRAPPKFSQSAFWKLSKPCLSRDTPFFAEAVGRSFTKPTASFWHFCFNVLPQGKTFNLRLRPFKILRDDTAEKALLTALRTRSIVSAGPLESVGRKTKMEKKTPLAQVPRLCKEKKKKKKGHLCVSAHPTTAGKTKGCLHESSDSRNSRQKKPNNRIPFQGRDCGWRAPQHRILLQRARQELLWTLRPRVHQGNLLLTTL